MARSFTVFLAFFLLFSTSFASRVYVFIDSLDNPLLHRSSDWGSVPASTTTDNASLWFTFNGTDLTVRLRTDQTYGYVGIEIDGIRTVHDTYVNSTQEGSLCAICSASMDYGVHNVTLIKMGASKNTTSSSMWINELSYATDGSSSSSTEVESTTSAETSTPFSLGDLTSSSTASSFAETSSESQSTTSISSDSTSPPTNNSSGSIDVPALVAGIICGHLVLALIFVLVTCMIRRRRASHHLYAPEPYPEAVKVQSSPFLSPIPTPSPQPSPPAPPLRPMPPVTHPRRVPIAEKLRWLKGEPYAVPQPTSSSPANFGSSSQLLDARDALAHLETASQQAPPPSYASVR